MKLNERFPELRYLFRGYYHQDWMDEYEDESDAIRSFVFNNDSRNVMRAIQQLNELIAMNLKEPDLCAAVVDDLGSACFPDPADQGGREWLLWIRDTLTGFAAEKAAQERADAANSKIK